MEEIKWQRSVSEVQRVLLAFSLVCFIVMYGSPTTRPSFFTLVFVKLLTRFETWGSVYTCGPLSVYCSVYVRLPFIREATNRVTSQESPHVLWYSKVRCRVHKKRPQGPTWPRLIHSVSFKRISSRSIWILTFLLRLYSLSFSERKFIYTCVLFVSLILFLFTASF